jgi:hypothetical protein
VVGGVFGSLDELKRWLLFYCLCKASLLAGDIASAVIRQV